MASICQCITLVSLLAVATSFGPAAVPSKRTLLYTRTTSPTSASLSASNPAASSGRRSLADGIILSSATTSMEDDDDDNALSWLQDTEQSAQKKVKKALDKTDKNVLKRVMRIGNHVPALISLSYFGLISMASGSMTGSETGRSALARVLTMPLGTTSSATFSSYFPTLVTPPSPIFLVWPLIATTQLATLLYSALRPNKEPLVSQVDLTALSLANLGSAAWLFASSIATPTYLPLACLYILPLVPLVSGYPLRDDRLYPKRVDWKNFVFSLYSSFTTLASLLALAVELQHGGRVPFLGGKAELVASLFLVGYAFVVRFSGLGRVKRSVNAAVISGILVKRLGQITTLRNLLSPSLLGTCAVCFMAVKRLKKTQEEQDEDQWEEVKSDIKDNVKNVKDVLTEE